MAIFTGFLQSFLLGDVSAKSDVLLYIDCLLSCSFTFACYRLINSFIQNRKHGSHGPFSVWNACMTFTVGNLALYLMHTQGRVQVINYIPFHRKDWTCVNFSKLQRCGDRSLVATTDAMDGICSPGVISVYSARMEETPCKGKVLCLPPSSMLAVWNGVTGGELGNCLSSGVSPCSGSY